MQTFRRAKDIRTTFDRGGLHSESGTYDGEHWVQNYNGLTRAITPTAGLEADEHYTVTVSRVTIPIEAYVITRTNVRGRATRTFYDAITNRIARVEADGTTLSIEDFATFGNVTRPKHWTVTSKASQLEQRYERTELQTNASTNDDVRETETRRLLVEFPAGITDVALPVQLARKNIIVRLQFGKRGVDFILDTGSSGILVDTALAKELGLTLINATSQITARRYTGYDAIVADIGIGQLHMHNIAVRTGPLPFAPSSTIAARGLLGFDFLAQLGVSIDYEHGTVHVTPAEQYVPPAGGRTFAIDVDLNDATPTTTVTAGEAVAEHMTLDTGYSGEIAFFDYFTRRYPGSFKNAEMTKTLLGVGGSFIVDNFRFPAVTLGKIRFLDFLVARVPPGSFNYNLDGLIGNVTLSMFNVGLDYTHGRVYLTPNSAGTRAIQKR